MANPDKTQTDSPASSPVAELFKPHKKIPFLPIIGICITAIVAIGVVIGLMCQSNSFIAQRQDPRSQAASSEDGSTRVIESTKLSTVDQRFGVGGNCEVVKKLGSSVTLNWGGGFGGVPFNTSEINCATSTNGAISSILTFGHADSWDYNNTVKLDLPSKKNAFFAKYGAEFPDVRKEYDALEALISKYETLYNSPKILGSYLSVPDVVALYPSAYIEIANEPDWLPYFSPEDFAKYYTYFYRQVRRFDKTAKISFGGLAWPRYNHAHRQVAERADWSTWKDQASQMGGSGQITTVSKYNNETHVTRGNKVFVNYSGSSNWEDVTHYLKISNKNDKSDGKVTSFFQYKKPSGVRVQYYVRDGIIWYHTNSDGNWSDWSPTKSEDIKNKDANGNTIAVGSGWVQSFSETSEGGSKIGQYVVRCQEQAWNTASNTCINEAYRLFYRYNDNKPDSKWSNWSDITSNLNGFGVGPIYFFSNDSSKSPRSQILIQGNQALERSIRGKVIVDNSLVNDSYIQQLINNNPAQAETYKNAAWFLIFYKELQKINPIAQFDYLNIHPYAWTANNSSYTANNIGAAVADTKATIQHIDTLRQLNLTPNLKSKPIIITEFSHAGNMDTKTYGHCTTIELCEAQAKIISKAYIDGIVPWLKSSTLVHKWLWFEAAMPFDRYHAANMTILQKWGTQLMYEIPTTTPAPAQLNETAKAYVNQMRSSNNRDITSPNISSITNSSNANRIDLQIEVTESNPSAAYEYWYCLGKSAGACDVRSWKSSLTADKKNMVSIDVSGLGANLATTFATVKVKDSAGNASQVISGYVRSFQFPIASKPDCARVEISSIGGVCANGGYQATMSWSPVAGATEYYIAYDDDTQWWADNPEIGEPISGGSTTQTNKTFNLTTDLTRYFRVRVSKSETCKPGDGLYGQVKTISAPVCTNKNGGGGKLKLSSSRRVIIRARGVQDSGIWPKLELHIKDSGGVYRFAKAFDIKTVDYKNYSYTNSNPFDASQVRLKYVNDFGARNVYVDYIKIGGSTYQTEAETTYSTGTWQSSTKQCTPGFISSEALHCNGYFDFFK